MSKLLRVGIDCRLAGPEHAGIGRYIEQLVANLPPKSSIEWVFFIHHENQLTVPSGLRHALVVAPIRHYTLAEQLQMPRIFAAAKLDLLHVPHFNIPLLYRGPMVVTIHDLLWHEQQGSHVTTLSPLVYALKYRAYRFVASQAMRRAKRIFVPTEVIKSTIRTFETSVPADRIIVTPEGVDQKWFQPVSKKKREQVLFYTGSLYPHKNVKLVAQALQELTDFQLYISSSRSVFVDQFMKDIRRLGVGERVHHLGQLSDDDLKTWYSRSTALVQPSLSEGFGLTGIEAMAAGVSVIASSIPVFEEVYGERAVFFTPTSVPAFVEAVHRAQTRKEYELLAAQKHARTFSWERMAHATASVYAALIDTASYET